jgi:hypothetical protein
MGFHLWVSCTFIRLSPLLLSFTPSSLHRFSEFHSDFTNRESTYFETSLWFYFAFLWWLENLRIFHVWFTQMNVKYLFKSVAHLLVRLFPCSWILGALYIYGQSPLMWRTFFNNYLTICGWSSLCNTSLCCEEAGHHDAMSFDYFDFSVVHLGSDSYCHCWRMGSIRDRGNREYSTQHS